MKILHVINDTDPVKGGVAQGIRTLINSCLAKEGIFNEVLSLDNPHAKYLKEDIFYINVLGPGKGPWSYNPNLIPWLVENLSRFDIVIVHGIWLFHNYAVWKAKQILENKNRIVKTPVPRILIFPQGMLDPYFQHAPGRKLKAIRNWIYWKLVEGKVINDADRILFTAEDEKLLARETFKPYHPKSEVVVGMGVESPPLYTTNMLNAFREKCPELKGSPYLLFLSRIHEKKGVDILISAYADIVLKLNTLNNFPKLVIAGPGLETKYGKKIKNIISTNSQLNPLVFFTGMLTGNAKWGAFYGCEAFALTTHQENFGIAIVEALACGKPVLISNKTNIWREIKDGNAGLVCNDTLDEIKSILEYWFKISEDSKIIFSQNALKTYKKHFSIDSITDQWISSLK